MEAHFTASSVPETSTMKVITQANSEEDGFFEDSSANDGLLFILVGLFCLFVLGMAIRLCYKYVRKFPEKDEGAEPYAELINRNGISSGGKGTMSTRYSVA